MLHHMRKIFLGIFLLTLLGCGGGGGGGSHSGMHNVRYEVSSYSLHPLNITYVDENGDSQTVSDVYVNNQNWTHSFSAASGTTLSLSASLEGTDNDTYWVNIYLDNIPGPVIEKNQNLPGVPAIIEYTISND
jgi:hypothetical protein